jgi:hypothetical protein
MFVTVLLTLLIFGMPFLLFGSNHSILTYREHRLFFLSRFHTGKGVFFDNGFVYSNTIAEEVDVPAIWKGQNILF